MPDKTLKDDLGVLRKASEILPSEFCCKLIKALAELEDNEAHRTHTFPKTNLHKVENALKGVNVYRAYIDKTSGWRLHVQYSDDGSIRLNDILTGQEHDNVTKVIKSRKGRYK